MFCVFSCFDIFLLFARRSITMITRVIISPCFSRTKHATTAHATLRREMFSAILPYPNALRQDEKLFARRSITMITRVIISLCFSRTKHATTAHATLRREMFSAILPYPNALRQDEKSTVTMTTFSGLTASYSLLGTPKNLAILNG